MENNVLELAHQKSRLNKLDLENSTFVGCFHCKTIFEIKDNPVKEYVDEDQTALCPFCGIDSLLGDKSGFELTPEFLEMMNKKWFEKE